MTPVHEDFIGQLKGLVADATITVVTDLSRRLITVEVSWPCNGMRRAVREGLDMWHLSQGAFDYEHLVYRRLLHRVGTAALEDKIGADED